MQIAVYVDRAGQIASLYEPGMFRLYQGGPGAWTPGLEIPLCLQGAAGAPLGIAPLKAALHGAVAALGDCRLLLSGALRGLPYSVLQEELGFETWRSEGELTAQLDNVAAQATKTEAARAQALVLSQQRQIPRPVPMGGPEEGWFWLDLAAALDAPAQATSRDILIPFLEAKRFQKLEILCDHLPKWLAWELERLQLAAETEEVDATGKGVRLLVYPPQTADGRRRPVGLPGGSAPQCLPCPRQQGRAGAAGGA